MPMSLTLPLALRRARERSAHNKSQHDIHRVGELKVPLQAGATEGYVAVLNLHLKATTCLMEKTQMLPTRRSWSPRIAVRRWSSNRALQGSDGQRECLGIR